MVFNYACTYPVNKENVRALVGQYRSYVNETGRNPFSAEALRSMALLYAFYLNNIDSAIVLLDQAIQMNPYDPRFVNRSKLDLGDIELLKGEPWEATLLYSQVEKAMKDDPLGYQAKLSNAKLSYYSGEFALAQEHLDILKLATTREISNDAMDLSIFIQVNMGLDSNTTPLSYYSVAQQLLFQNRLEEALMKLDSIFIIYPNHDLSDDIYFLEASIYRRKGSFDTAIAKLEKIKEN